MKDFLSIKEFSKFSGIEASTLRYWDDIGLFSPRKRNPENNYRYYTPEQLIAVNFITVLSDLNVPLKTISEAENDRDPSKMIKLIEQQEKILDVEMHKMRERYSIMITRREFMYRGMNVDESELGVMFLEDKPIIFGPRNVWKEGDSFYESFVNYSNHAKKLRINLSFPIGGYHENAEDFIKAPGRPDYFFSLDPTGNDKLPAGDYLVGFNRGYYGEFGDTPQRLAEYAKKNAVVLSGPVYCIYLFDEVCIKDASKYLVQVCVGVPNTNTPGRCGRERRL